MKEPEADRMLRDKVCVLRERDHGDSVLANNKSHLNPVIFLLGDLLM